MNTQSFITNIATSKVKLDKPVSGLDLFEISGLPLYPPERRYREAGKIRLFLSKKYSVPMAEYYSSEGKVFIIGDLSFSRRKGESEEISNIRAEYAGKCDIEPDDRGKKALIALLNDLQESKLRRTFFSTSRHFFYDKRKVILKGEYKGRDLYLFRGLSFRYDILDDGTVTVALDVHTHYVDSRTLLDDIMERNSSVFIAEELKRKKDELRKSGRNTQGIRFYYELASMTVQITSLSSNFASKVKLKEPIEFNGHTYSDLIGYLEGRYPDKIAKGSIVEEQVTVMDKKGLEYLPQFLHRVIPQSSLPVRVKNKEMYLAEGNDKDGWNHEVAARNRWQLIKRFFYRNGFSRIKLGDLTLDFSLGNTMNANHFAKPRLECKNEVITSQYNLIENLKRGLYDTKKIEKFCIFADKNIDHEFIASFYKTLRNVALDSYNVALPENYYPVPSNVQETENFLSRMKQLNGNVNIFLLSIVKENSGSYANIVNACGRLEIANKSIREESCIKVVKNSRQKNGILLNTLFPIFARSGSVPWIISTRLSYAGYVFVDVGRSLSEYWSFGCVLSKDGLFSIWHGKQMKGEDLDKNSIEESIEFAERNIPQSNTLIYVRDGSIAESEFENFKEIVEQYPNLENVAIVSYMKNVPFRIFRSYNGRISKAFSGDYISMDPSHYIICNSGRDFSRQGTPSTRSLEIINLRGKIDKKSIVEDLYKMCFLNWGSPRSPYSDPAPLHVIDDYLYELSRGIQRHGLPF
ncbi:MAG: hypothetical protein M1285_02550 [Candidatus Thermoplasmatota archaeon]|nr:hypothetical protein [Candidatus Thermoplasmatota archaeon]